MRIAFDHQAFSRQAYGGVSRYYYHLINELIDWRDLRVKVFSPWYINRYLKDLPADAVRGSFLTRYPLRATPVFQAINGILGKRDIFRWQPDIVHETYFSPKAAGPGHVPSVLTVYDMIHERYPGEFWPWDRTRENKKKAVARASHVICISESTRRDLVEFLNVPPEKTSVVYLAYEKFDMPDDDQMGVAANIKRPFILYVGHRGGYKNFRSLLKAVAASSALSSQFDIVCFGGGNLTRQEQEMIHAYKLDGRVWQLSGSDALLGQMYCNAAVFVYPSIYEGFGLPPLEAMAQGCPVVCSNASSLPEVVGNAGEYFNPLDTDALRTALEQVLFSSGRRSELITLGQQRLPCFSWKKCAEETIKVYEKVK